MKLRQSNKSLIVVASLLWFSLVNAQDCSTDCQTNSQSRVSYVERLLKQQRFAEASDQLEEILMQDPQNQTVERIYRRLLQQQQSMLKSTLTGSGNTAYINRWQSSGELQVRGGYSSNFNRAPLQSEFTLTIPNNPIRVQLDSQFRPKSGLGNDIQLAAKAHRSYSDQLDWQLSGNFQARQTGNEGYSDYQSGAISSGWYHKLEEGGGYALTLATNTIHYANDINIYLLQSQLKRIWKINSACNMAGGVEGYWQHQGNTNNLDGHYTGGIVGLNCDINQINYQAYVGGGLDWASSQRLGGDQWRSRIGLQAILPVTFIKDNALLKINGSYQANQDQQRYSMLIKNGQTREYMGYELGVDIELPISEILENLKAVAAVNWQKQNSTIDIFKIDVLEGWVGFKLGL